MHSHWWLAGPVGVRVGVSAMMMPGGGRGRAPAVFLTAKRQKVAVRMREVSFADVTFEWETLVNFADIIQRNLDNDSDQHQLCDAFINYMEIRILVPDGVKDQLQKTFPNVCEGETSCEELERVLTGVFAANSCASEVYKVDGDMDLYPGPNVPDWHSPENLIRLDFPANVFFDREGCHEYAPDVSTLYDHLRAKASKDGEEEEEEDKEWLHIFKTQMLPWGMHIAEAFLTNALQQSGLDGVVVTAPDRYALINMYDQAERNALLRGETNWPFVRGFTESKILEDTAVRLKLASMPVRFKIEERA